MGILDSMTQKHLMLIMNTCRVLLIGLFAIMLVAALHPDVRSQVRGTLVRDFRMVISTAQGDLLGNGAEVTVAKVKTRDALMLEIYESSGDGNQKLVERIAIPDRRDGFFNFNGKATNLAIDDIDGDGRPEILAPSFDQNLVGHLNVYRYSAEARGFERMLR